MARVDPADVEDIADFSVLESSDLQPFIEDANLFIDDRLSGEGLSTDMLKLLEKWVAAHLASMKEQRVHVSDAGATSFEYEGDADGMGLKYTRYGQTAMVLDPTGLLESGESDQHNVVETVNTEE